MPGDVTLYWSFSLNPQKARLALNALEIEHEVVMVDLLAGAQNEAAFCELNPMGQVPVLEDGAMVLAESNAIIAWLGDKHRRLWPATSEGRAQALRWLFFEASHLGDLAGNIWFERCLKPLMGAATDPVALAQHRERIARPLGYLEARLTAQRWAMDDGFTLVDCALAPALDALDISGFDFAAWPAAADYLARMRAMPAWARCDFRNGKGEKA